MRVGTGEDISEDNHKEVFLKNIRFQLDFYIGCNIHT